uniref:CTCK domain-containing protein n=1 Tax=Callorhinchus milii TaxID=7868 RepID=A0A4W3H385_CALMI
MRRRLVSCVALEEAETASCEGTCDAHSMYSTEANSMDHKCTCCQETMTHEKEILLLCPDGTTIQHRYIYVDECNCVKMNCEEITNTTTSSSLKHHPPCP